MASIESRVAALAAAVRRRQFTQEGPVDGLSASMFALEDELLSLDMPGKSLLLAELNQSGEDGSIGLTPEDMERWIDDIRQNRKFVW